MIKHCIKLAKQDNLENLPNMDHTDKEILRLLQNNAKQNTKEIALKIGLSTTPTYERIRKLEQQGYIKKYTALLDRKKVGAQLIVYCSISLLQHKKEFMDHFKSSILKLNEVVEFHHISGNFDYLLKIMVKDMNQFQEFINEKLSLIDNISTIQSSFVMKSLKEDSPIPFS